MAICMSRSLISGESGGKSGYSPGSASDFRAEVGRVRSLRLMKMSICWMARAPLAARFAAPREIGAKPVSEAIMRNCPNYAYWSNHI